MVLCGTQGKSWHIEDYIKGFSNDRLRDHPLLKLKPKEDNNGKQDNNFSANAEGTRRGHVRSLYDVRSVQIITAQKSASFLPEERKMKATPLGATVVADIQPATEIATEQHTSCWQKTSQKD